MYRQVAVNPGQIVINDGSTFLVTAADGSIDDGSAQGLFAQDTRLISYYENYLNRSPLELLASSTINHHAARYVYTNPALETVAGSLPKNSLMIELRRDLSDGMHEDIDITNWHGEQVEVDLAIALRSDFADLFQVKSGQILTHGKISTQWNAGELSIDYRSGDFHRGLLIRCDNEGSELHNANGRLVFRIKLEHGQRWHTCLDYLIRIGEETSQPTAVGRDARTTESGEVHRDFVKNATRIQCSAPTVARAFERAIEHLGALRLKVKVDNHDAWMPAAGIPWFMAVFGRDSILVSLQTLAVHREFASATLAELAGLQATEVDDWRDAQPGRMPHELRHGELTQLGKKPYSPYYGTIDATPLWIITLAESLRWSGDDKVLRHCETALHRALDWIEKYGDFDNDGFVEYLSRSSEGAYNQGWKDSGKAIVYPDGSKVTAPIALCEVQGEVYLAWKHAADLLDRLGDAQRADKLRHQADDLYNKFNDRFWMDDESFYCLGLDFEKKPIRSIASNAGQLLWTGIVPEDRAALVVKRLFEDDLWCGWGIRTLSSKHAAYNPLSYQLGSVWPMDNAMIAIGLWRYGFYTEAQSIAEAVAGTAGGKPVGRASERGSAFLARRRADEVRSNANQRRLGGTAGVAEAVETLVFQRARSI